jgi:hypothetical protein
LSVREQKIARCGRAGGDEWVRLHYNDFCGFKASDTRTCGAPAG